MNVTMHESWKKRLQDEFDKDYFQALASFVKKEYNNKTIYPKPRDIFRAFDLCPFENVKVVILGQDPYHGKHQAHGLCFSVGETVAIPPSLQNIFQEMESDLDVSPPLVGNLDYLAKQGVLLLNATLTVEAHKAGSHQNKGWEQFTDAAIKLLSDEKENLVFLLWGKYAQQKGEHIDIQKHLVLTATHPSPFSAHSGFFGCKHFSKTNTYLHKNKIKEIDWTSNPHKQ